MPVGNDKYYKPDEALHELMMQETIMNLAVDIQALLRILVEKEIISRDEVNAHREEVRNRKMDLWLQSKILKSI